MSGAGPRRGRSRRVAAAVLALVLAALLVASTGPGAGAGQDDRDGGATTTAADPGLLEISSISPWVQADGDFQVRFAPSSTVPADATFSYTVHQRVRADGDTSLRAAVDDVIDGGRLPGVLQSTVTVPVAALGNPAEGLVLDVPVRSVRDGSDRVLLPTPGIHPVELELTDAAGETAWHALVLLNRLPSDPVTGADGQPGRMSVTMVLPVDSAPTLAPDGTVVIDPARREAVDGATHLLTTTDTRLQLALRPNVLSAVTRSEDPRDQAFLDALRAGADRATVNRWPYASVDTGGLVDAGAGDELVRQVALGDSTLRDATGADAQQGSWYLDDTISTESLGLLQNLGATRVVVSPDRLRMADGVDQEASQRAAVALGRSGLTATAFDAALSFRLTDRQVPAAQRANQAVSDLMAAWFTAAERPTTSFPGPSAVLVVPPTSDPEVVQALGSALSAGGPLSSDPADVPSGPAEVDGRDLTATLSARTPDDQSTAVDQVRSTRDLIDGFRSMAPAADTDADNWDDLNAETLARDLPVDDRLAIHAAIAADVDRRVAAIQLPRSRRVVLTSRDATIPLRFRNDLPVDVHLVMRARSLRLEVDGGETREIVLHPGENRIDLPVEVRASGASLLRIDLSSPDGAIDLPTASMPVTSSTISGVGFALSVISLLFLAGWWISTTRRKRRRTARDDGGHPSGDPQDATAAQDEPSADVPGTEAGDATEGPDLRAAPAGVGPSGSPDGPAGSVQPGGRRGG